MKKDLNLKYTLLFGGGAIRGVAYCGAFKALEEFNFRYDTIAGSSVGAIFAGLVAVGYTADEIRDIMFRINYELFKDIQLAISPQFALCKGEVFLDWMRELIEKKFYGQNYQKGKNKAVTFSDIEKNLVIITTDLSNFECKEFSKKETPDFEIATAVRISCAMPGLMKPIEYNNTLLVDGDLQKSAPMWSLTKTLQPGNERVLEFRLEGDFQGNDHNAVEYINALYSYATSTGTKFLTQIYGCRDDYDYITIDTGDVNIVDFNIPEEKRAELVNRGYNQALNYITKDLKAKKANLLKIYKKMDSLLSALEKNLSKAKISEAKCNLGELYIELCDNINIINSCEKTELVKFKNIFIENIKNPILFGQTKLSNEKLVQAQFMQLKQSIQSRISEYEDFLSTI